MIAIRDLGDDKTSMDSTAFGIFGDPVAGTPVTELWFNAPDQTTQQSDVTLTYSNSESTSKVYKNYFIVHASARTGGSGDTSTVGMESTVSVSSTVKEQYIKAPQNIETPYDKNNSQWLDTLASDNSWIEDLYFTKEEDGETFKYVELKGIKYTSPDGKTIKDEDLGTDTTQIKDAGTYSVTLGRKNLRWYDEKTQTFSIADKTFNIKITQTPIDSGSVVAEVVYAKDTENPTQNKKYFAGTGVSGFPTIQVKDDCDWKSKGTIAWDAGQILSESKSSYNWTFTPTDTNTAPYKGTSEIKVEPIKVSSIEAELNGTDPIYTSTKKEDLLERITVKKTYNNGGEPVEADTSTEIEITSTLEAGKNKKITLKLKGSNPAVTCELEIPEILAVKPAELIVTLKNASSKIYVSTSLDDLKKLLKVQIKNNDGTTAAGEVAAADYTFAKDFKLAEGECTVPVEYTFGEGEAAETVNGEIKVNVLAADIKSVVIEKVEVPAGTDIWEGAAANTIQEYLTVKITYNDGKDSTKVLDPKEDAFDVKVIGDDEDTLYAGECSFQVVYNEVTSDNVANITVTAVMVTEITVSYAQGNKTIYSSVTAEELDNTSLIVTAKYNNNPTGSKMKKGEYTVSIPKNFSSENNTITVTWTKGDVTKTATCTVNVTDVEVSSVEAEFELPAGKKITAANGLDDLKEYVTATLKYNNGDEKTLKAADYTLEAEESELQESGNLKAGERTITLKYSDGITNTFTVTVEKATVEMGGATFTPAGGDGGNNGDLKPSSNGGFSGTYKPDGEFGIGVDPEDLPDGVTPKEPVYKKWTGKGEPTYDVNGKPTGSGWTSLPAGTKPTGAGTYVAEIDFDYDDDNFEPIDPVSTIIDIGKADVDTDGTTFAPAGGSESGLKPSDNGGYAGTYTDGGKYDIDIDPKTLPDGVTAGTPVYKKLKDGGDPANEGDWEVVTKPDGAGTYKVVVELTSDDPDNYNDIDPIETVLVLSEAKKGLDLPTIEDIVFSNALVSIADKLGGSYTEHKDIITLGGIYDGVKNAGVYTATLTLTDDNYYWNESAGTGAQSNAKKVTFAGGTFTVNGQVATLTWRILPYVLSADNWALTGKEGAVYNLPAALTEGLDVGVNYRYFEDKASEALEDGAALSEGAQYFVKAELFGTDAYNFVFDGTLSTTSDFAEYKVPAGFLANAINFLKANWIWLVIALVAVILLITIIAVAAKKSKKKKQLAEKKEEERIAREERKEEERERKEEERRQREEERRREEREERMMRMSQPQAMPQMQMAQPQYMPQAMPQMMPQAAQPMSMGGANEIAELKAEISALKATQENMRAEQTAKELAALKAEQAAMRAEQNTAKEVTELRNEITFAKRDDHVVQGGISLDKLTELIRTEVNNAFDSREKAAAQNATAMSESGTPANAAPAAATQVPPDAVMTTVTTTKIDTTKKSAQGNAQTTSARPIVRNYVAPMPVDDGRVFDVGGFYKPADPLTDFMDDGEEKKD